MWDKKVKHTWGDYQWAVHTLYIGSKRNNQPRSGSDHVHVESCTYIHYVLYRIYIVGGLPSISLNLTTPAEMIENFLDMVKYVLVTTNNTSFGGQVYISTLTDKDGHHL